MVNIKISNRLLYTFIAIALAIAIIGVAYAYANPTTGVGHGASDIGPGTMQGPININGSLKVTNGTSSIEWKKTLGDYGYDTYTPIPGAYGGICIASPNVDTCDDNINSLYDCALTDRRTCVDLVNCYHQTTHYTSAHGYITCTYCDKTVPYAGRNIVCKRESRMIQTSADEILSP